MKIELQSGSNAVSTLKGAIGPAQLNLTDFKSAFTSAVASSAERSGKAPQPKDAKSSTEGSKHKDTPAQTSTATLHSDLLSASQPVTPKAVIQGLPEPTTVAHDNTAVLPVSQFVVPTSDQTSSAPVTTGAVDTAAVSASQPLASGDQRAMRVPATAELGTLPLPTSQAIGAESVPATPVLPVAADQESATSPVGQQLVPTASNDTTPELPTLGATVTGPSSDVSSQLVAPASGDATNLASLLPVAAHGAKSGSDIVSKSLPASGAVVKGTNQEAQTTKSIGSSELLGSSVPPASTSSSASTLLPHHSADAPLTKQPSLDLSAKAVQAIDSTPKKQDSAVDRPVQATAERSGTSDFQAHTAGDSATQSSGATTASGAVSGTMPASFTGLTSAVNVQSTATSNFVTAQSVIPGSTLIGKEPTNGQVGSSLTSSTKVKDGPSVLRDKRSDDSTSDSDSSNVSATSSAVAKVSETSSNAGQNSNNQGGNADKTAVQLAVSTNQTAAPDHAQPAGQTASAPVSTPAHTQTAAAGPVSTLQEASGVSSAQLTQSMHHAEMRLGMQSAEFGDISISTSINHQALSAQISIDHSELGKALAVHLPAIEAKLGSAYGLEARVEVRDGGSASPSYSNSGQQSRERSQSQSGSSALQTGSAPRMGGLNESTTASVAASTSRLDIRI